MVNQPESKDARRRAFLSSQHTRLATAVYMWNARLMDLFHPITSWDGTYWRQGKWNKPTRDESVRERKGNGQ